MEKAYVTMKNSGAGNIAVGIIIPGSRDHGRCPFHCERR